MAPSRDLAARIGRRGALAAVPVPTELAAVLAEYIGLLDRWNRKINLTSFDLTAPSDEALDRLLIEPIAAARYLQTEDEFVVDVGSGGGSPALPLKLAVPRLRMILVESKIRKAAFLREAIRHLGLTNIAVEGRRLEELTGRADLRGEVDVITLRAVRIDARLVKTLGHFLRPGGRLFAFGAGDVAKTVQQDKARVELLVPSLQSKLGIVVI